MANATVQLEFVDVLDSPLDDPGILIEFFSADNSKHFRVSLSPQGAPNVSIKLEDPGNGIYRVLIMPSNYRIMQFFLRIIEGETVTRAPVVFPVHPDKVVDIAAPVFERLPGPLQALLAGASLAAFQDAAGLPLRAGALYGALPPLLKAALLNLWVKSSATVLGDGEAVSAKLGALIQLKQDRLFAKVTAGLVEETMQDPFFHSVNDVLHETIPPYHLLNSFKTRDAQGNLQLTFSRNGETGNDYLVDMDIDQAQGIGHIFEVLQNAVTSGLTNPYDVREILAVDQGLRPLYGFRFAASGSAMIAAVAG